MSAVHSEAWRACGDSRSPVAFSGRAKMRRTGWERARGCMRRVVAKPWVVRMPRQSTMETGGQTLEVRGAIVPRACKPVVSQYAGRARTVCSRPLVDGAPAQRVVVVVGGMKNVSAGLCRRLLQQVQQL